MEFLYRFERAPEIGFAYFNLTELAVGLATGVVLAIFHAIIGRSESTHQHRRFRHISSTALVAAVLISIVDNRPIGIAVGVAIATVGHAIFSISQTQTITSAKPPSRQFGNQAALGIAGVIVATTTTATSPPWWIPMAFVGGAVVAALGLQLLDSQPAPLITELITAMIASTLIGLWACLADTEAVLLATGVLIPTLIGSLVPNLKIPRLPPWPTATLIAAIGAIGTEARPSAVLGAITCWGIIVVLPIFGVIYALRRSVVDFSRSSSFALFAVHLSAVIAASRWAARGGSVATGVMRSVSVIAIASALSALVASSGFRTNASVPERQQQ